MDLAGRLLAVIDQMPCGRIVLYGDLVLDRYILGTPKRISREAPIIILRHEGQQDIPGGGANALANFAALDVSVVPVGVVGDDEPGQTLLGLLAERGIDTRHVVRVEGFKTPTKVRILGGGRSSLKHQVARYDIEDVLPEAGPWRGLLTDQLRAAAVGADGVAVSDYGYGAVTQHGLATIRNVDRPPAWVCLDSRHRLLDLHGADGATPNLQELESTAGRPLPTDDDIADAAEELRERLGLRFALATRGNRGMTLAIRDRRPIHIGVFGTDEVADVTGAGDTVLAVLTAALVAGATPVEASQLANYAGGTVVMKLGTATVSRDELRLAVRRDLSGTILP